MGANQTTKTAKRGRGAYRVKNPFSPRDFAEMLGWVVAIVAVASGIGIALKIPIALMLYFTLKVPFGRYASQRTAFGVFAGALMVNGALVPWAAVEEIAVTGPTFAVRLGDTRHLPNLPQGLPLRPGPDGFHIHHTTPEPYDPDKLLAALRRHAPHRVTISGLGSPLHGEAAR
jgi:hypothetical protein